MHQLGYYIMKNGFNLKDLTFSKVVHKEIFVFTKYKCKITLMHSILQGHPNINNQFQRFDFKAFLQIFRSKSSI